MIWILFSLAFAQPIDSATDSEVTPIAGPVLAPPEDPQPPQPSELGARIDSQINRVDALIVALEAIAEAATRPPPEPVSLPPEPGAAPSLGTSPDL